MIQTEECREKGRRYGSFEKEKDEEHRKVSGTCISKQKLDNFLKFAFQK